MKRNTEIKQQLAQPEYKGCTYSINVHIKKENEVKHTIKTFHTEGGAWERMKKSTDLTVYVCVDKMDGKIPLVYFKPAHTSTQFTVWWIKNTKSQKILVVSN